MFVIGPCFTGHLLLWSVNSTIVLLGRVLLSEYWAVFSYLNPILVIGNIVEVIFLLIGSRFYSSLYTSKVDYRFGHIILMRLLLRNFLSFIDPRFWSTFLT